MIVNVHVYTFNTQYRFPYHSNIFNDGIRSNLNLSLSGVPIPNMQLDHSFDFDHACIVYNLVLVLNCLPFALRCSTLDVIARRQ